MSRIEDAFLVLGNLAQATVAWVKASPREEPEVHGLNSH